MKISNSRKLVIVFCFAVMLGYLSIVLAQNPKILNVGVIGQANSPTAHGIELAAERFNRQGNITTPDGSVYKLAVIAQNATTADDVGNAVAALKKQNVVAIFGPDDEALTLASLNTLNS